MSATETLREAATLLRKRSEAIGDWARRHPDLSGWPAAWFSPVFIENAFAEHAYGDADDPALREGWRADGELLASWNPAIAAHLAESLDNHAAEHDAYECGWVEPCALLRVARAYLGSDA